MFRLPSSMDFPGSKTFFISPRFRASSPVRGHILGKSAKEAYEMDPVFPHGDVDDLIYREEWAASDR